MSTRTTERGVRIAACLVGLVGLAMAMGTVSLFAGTPSPGSIFFDVVVAAIALYLVFIGYTSLRRFSPWTVRHTFGALACFAYAGLVASIGPGYETAPSGYVAAVLIGSLFALIWGYRRLSDKIIRACFGNQRTDAGG